MKTKGEGVKDDRFLDLHLVVHLLQIRYTEERIVGGQRKVQGRGNGVRERLNSNVYLTIYD